MGFPRQEDRSVLPFPSPGDHPNPGVDLGSLMSPALAGGFVTTSSTWVFYAEVQKVNYNLQFIAKTSNMEQPKGKNKKKT